MTSSEIGKVWKRLRKSRCVQFSILKCTQRKYFHLPNELGVWNSKHKLSLPSHIQWRHKKLENFENRLRKSRRVQSNILKCTQRKYFQLPNELGFWNSKHKLSLPSHTLWYHQKLKKFDNVQEKALLCNLVY